MSPDPDELHEEGQRLYDEGDVYGAVQRLRTAMRIDPEGAITWLKLGLWLEDLEQYRDAIRHLEEALRLGLQPEHASFAHQGIGLCHEAMNRLDEAMRSYRAGLEAHESTAGWIFLGVLQRQVGELDAIESYRNALALEADNEEAMYNLAVALCFRADYAEAELLFRKAIAIDPAYAVAYRELGYSIRKQERFEEALPYLHKSLELGGSEGDPWIRIYLGECYEALERLEEARANYEKACEADSAWSLPFRMAGSLYWRLGQLEKTEELYRHALELEPTEPKTSFCLGKLLLENAGGHEGRRFLRQALALESDPSESWVEEALELLGEQP